MLEFLISYSHILNDTSFFSRRFFPKFCFFPKFRLSKNYPLLIIAVIHPLLRVVATPEVGRPEL